MTPSPATLNPVSPAPSQAARGKPQESAPDSPFSQVLSSEIAQNRRGGTEPGDAKRPLADDAVDEADAPPVPIGPGARPDDTVLAAAYDLLRAATPADARADGLDPAAVLALPLPLAPDALRPAPATDAGDAGTDAPGVGDGVIGREPRKGPLARALQAAQADQAAGPAKPAADTALKAASFSTQLSAAQHADGARTGDVVPSLVADAGLKSAAPVFDEPAAVQNTPLSNRLAPTVGTAAWGQALGEKIVWMAAGAQQTASLTLNPPNLGPVQVVLNVTNDQATASFFSAQPDVRHALEAAFPRLREMMNEAGIQLGQASVSADTPPQQQAFDAPARRSPDAFGPNGETAAAEAVPAQALAPRAGRGLVDTFA